MKAHVICCNDGLYCVVIDDVKKARRKMNMLKRAAKKAYHGRFDYEDTAYWHIHTLDAE